MSTRCSFFYSHDGKGQTHVFEDLAEENGLIFIEKTQTIDSRLALSLEELLSIGQSFDINELRRQVNLTDEQLFKGATNYVEKCLNTKSFFQGIYFADFPEKENTPKEAQIEFRFVQFKKTRDKLKELLTKVESNSKSGHKFYFGLEDIK
jgi:hypothetical protein